MAGERIQRALARIEAAAARIDRAGSQRPLATPPGGEPELEHKYHALRDEAGAALAELDRLLVALEP
jgi:hypothetical protein